MAAKKKTAKPISSFDDLDAAGIGVGYQPFVQESGEQDAAPSRVERTWGQAIGDTAVQLAEGVNTTLGAVPSIVAPDGAMAGFFRDNADYWRDKQSEVLKQRIAATDQRIQEAGKEGVLSQIGTAASEYWNDPAQAARLVATNLPSMAATLGTGALAGATAKGVAAARGLDAANKAALAAQYGTRTAMATNAALNAGGARGEAYEDLKRAALAQGMSPEQAEQAALDGSVLPGVVGGVAGAVSGKLGLEKALLGQPGAGTGTALRRSAGAFGAELAGEQIEEVAPKITTNYEAGKIDPARGLTDDLGRTMVETTIGAGPGALVAGGVEGMNTPAQAAADAIRATETVPESGPMTRASNAATEAKAQAIEAGAPLVDEQATAEPTPEPVDDPVRDQILALPDGARQDALRAYAVVNRTDVAKGVQQYNRKLLDRLLTENAPPPVLGESLTGTDMGTMLGGGGMAGNTDPLMGALGMGREAQANSITNVANVAERRPPMPASDAARMLDEARNRGLDLAVAEHPAGGFVLVPPNWVTPDMAAQGEARLNETIARMQQADGAPVERAPRTRTEPVDLNLPTDPVQNYVGNLRQVNTPAAQAFVRDFDAGRITPADVRQRMQAEQGVTPDQRLQRAASEAPRSADPVADRLRQAVSQAATPAPTDILNPAGEPFKTRMAADRAAKKTPGAVVPVEGGFVVRPQEPVNVQDVPQAPEVPQAAATIGPPGQAPQAVGAQPAGPAAGVPAEGAGAVEAAGVSGEFADLFDEQGRPKFPNAQSVKDFKERTGLGQAGVRAIQAAIQEGRPITVDEARQADLAGQERRQAALEQSKAESEAETQAAKQNSAKPTEPSKVLGDYEIPGIDGATNRVRVLQRGGRIEAIGLDEGTVNNDLSRLIQSGQTVEQALATLYGDHGPNEAPNPSRVKRAGQPTSAAAPAAAAGLTDGAPAENTGAQAAPAAGAQAQTQGAAWDELDPQQRTAVLSKAGWITNKGGLNVIGKRLLNTSWEQITGGTREIIARNIENEQGVAATAGVQQPPSRTPEATALRLGRDNTPLSEGGKPFKTRKAAGDAKKLQPMMRVVSVKGGYALAEKTPAQLAAEAKAARRLAKPRTGTAGAPLAAHEFIAAEGGLNAIAASDLGIDDNPRIGNRRLFAGRGRGLSMEQATQKLIQDGYLSEGASINDALTLIKTSLTRPQYNADGIERIAEAEVQAQFEDYLAAQEDALDEGDPWAGTPAEALDDFSDDMLEASGYDTATEAIKTEVRALLEMANAQGIDTESIMLEAHEQTRNATEQDYYEAAKSALEAAIAGSNRDRGTPAGGEGQGPGAAATSAAEQGLNQPVALNQQAQAATENVAPAVSTTVEMPPTRRQESSPFARFATGRYRIAIRDEGNGPYAEVVAIQRGSGVEIEMRMPGEALEHPAFSQLNARAQALFETPTAGMFDAEPPALELAAQTPAEAAARQEEAEQAEKSQAAAKRAADAAAKAEDDRKRIAQASVRAADSFELGQDPLDSLTGQGGLMFSRTGAKSPNAQQPTSRAWYDQFVSLLPASYRNDPHRREPLPAEDWNVQRASEVRSKVEALNKQLRGADDRKGYGPVSVDGLGNLQVDARDVSAEDLTGDIMALANELGAGIAATNVRSADARALQNSGFVSESSLAAIADRLMQRPFASPTNNYAKDSAPGAVMTYKPRGFPAVLFARDVVQNNATPARPTDSNARNIATQRLVDGLKAKWTRAPEIIVARNMQDAQIPQEVRDYDALLKSQGATGEPRGFIYQGKVYLLSDELKGPQQIAEVLFHEVLGHYGLRGAFGDGLKPILQQIGTMRRRDVLAKAREYGMVAKGLSDADTWAAMSERDRLSAAEEVLAEMAQSTPEIGFVQRAIAAIRNWLRAHVPGFKNLALTDADIIQAYILPARGFVTRSKETGAQSLERAMRDAGFSRAPAGDQTQTEAFKRWFGDGGVRNADGEPQVFYHGGASDFTGIRFGGRFDGAIFVREGAESGYGVKQHALYLNSPILEPDEMRDMLADNPQVLENVLGGNVDPDVLDMVAESLTDGSDYPNSQEVWDAIGAIDEADAQLEMQKLRGRVARALGFKAVRTPDEFGGETVMVLDASALKSATDNNGNFDPEDDRINFSRAGMAAKAVGDAIKSVTVTNIKQRAGFKLTDYLGIGLQALGRRQIVDIYGDLLPLAEYNRLVQQMEADKNEGGAEADKLVTRWAKLDDESKLADLMHDATLAQIDPDKPFADGDDKGKFLMLERKFKLLSDEAKAVYRDTRDAYKAHHAKVRSAIKERIERSEIKGERKAALLKQMDDEFFKAVKGVYFPLARFGQYAVTVKGPDGKVESVSRAETKAEAEALRNNLLSAFPRDKGFTVGRVMLSKDFIADRDAVGRGFMTELYQVLDKQDMDAAQRAELEDTLGQLYLSSLPDLSWAKHGIHRKGTPGFSQDARRAFAQNMFHGARYLAKLRYSDLMQDELAAMQKHVDDWREVEDFDQNSAQRVVDEMNKRHESLMNPKSNALSTALTSLGFVFHLGLSPASAMVNLSQTALVAYPIMGAKWGFGKASAALLKASAEAAKGKNDITGSLNADERAAYDEAVRAGTIDVTMAHDLAGIAQGEDAGVMWKIRPVMRWASFMFHHAERFNRQVTFVAAYRLAREAGADQKAAFEQATKATYDGHFDYSSSNRPRIMQGNVAKVLLLFKQYGQNMVYTLARNAQQAIKGESPEVRAQARKALGGLLATHAAAAGVLGLPMVTTLLAAASMIGGDDDEPWDAKVALQNMLADTFGQKPAEVLAHGLSRLTPWDISGKVGLDRLIFPDVQEGLEGQRLWESAATQALGPVGGIFGGALKGLDLMSDGHYLLGLEAMLPAVLRQGVKSIRYATEGAQDKGGVVIKDEVSLAGVAGQLLGFSPSEVRLAQEGKSAIYQQDKALAGRRQELLTKAARATMAKDAEARAEAMKEIQRFNEKNPTRRITPLNVLQSVRNRQKRIDQAEGGIYLPKNRRDAMDAGRFAVSE